MFVASTAIHTGDSHLWDTPEVKAVGMGMVDYVELSITQFARCVPGVGGGGGGVEKHSYENGSFFEHTDEEDVGKYAAAAPLGPDKFVGREIMIASERLSFEAVAEAMGRVIGRDVKVSKRTAEEGKEAES
ncbi:hypothetical protein AJ78_08128 [Emergomyces pasteurianus Ep9510]|uniref:NmrA-like domain-containing protein n=1 Tax=Emergomyces pasteurianus Ep9510 TaxID=1447872 RepID=A0A1J9Q430_9EURO|nr:hypothetical protein AJ78_08128 [Emergomyces pasteurianus Ep9510]